jgi:hypothetical protein
MITYHDHHGMADTDLEDILSEKCRPNGKGLLRFTIVHH